MLMVSKQRNTYSDWATEIGVMENQTVTKQSLNERMNPQTECFIKTVVEQQLLEKVQPRTTKHTKGILKHFNNVMIDDSTTISLPDELVKEFPGNVANGKRKSQAKIHAMYNMTENNFPFLHIHSFSNNDQSLAGDVLPFLKKGDLCLRDLGFLVLSVVEEFIKEKIYFVSRKTALLNAYDINTKQKINLVKELRKKKFIDRTVLIGAEYQLKVRLIAMPLSQAQTNERKRKAKTDRHQYANHSKQYYELLGYAIYITNIPPEKCNADNIFELYKLRWNIEIIFKSWKSCFNLRNLIHRNCKNVVRVKCIIYLMLLYIYLFHVVWWSHCQAELENGRSTPQLSILKLANFFFKYFEQIIMEKSDKNLFKQIKLHCIYENRKDRDNAIQFHLKLAA